MRLEKPGLKIEAKEVKVNAKDKDPLLPLILPLSESWVVDFKLRDLSELLKNEDFRGLMACLEIDWGRPHRYLFEKLSKALNFYQALKEYSKSTPLDALTKSKVLKQAFAMNYYEFHGESTVTPHLLQEFKLALESKVSIESEIEYKKQPENNEKKYDPIKISKAVIEAELKQYDEQKGLRRDIANFLGLDSKDSKSIETLKKFSLGEKEILPLESLLPLTKTILEAKSLATSDNRKSVACINSICTHIKKQTGLEINELNDLLKNLTYFKLLTEESLAILCQKTALRVKSPTTYLPLEHILKRLSFHGVLTLENLYLIYEKIVSLVDFSDIFDDPFGSPPFKDFMLLAMEALKIVDQINIKKLAKIYLTFSGAAIKILYALAQNNFYMVTDILVDTFSKIPNLPEQEFITIVVRNIPENPTKENITRITDTLIFLYGHKLFDRFSDFLNKNPRVNFNSLIDSINYFDKYDGFAEGLNQELFSIQKENGPTELTLLEQHFDLILNLAATQIYYTENNIKNFCHLLRLLTPVLISKIDSEHLQSFLILNRHHITTDLFSELYCLLFKISGSLALSIAQTIKHYCNSQEMNELNLKVSLPKFIERILQSNTPDIETSSAIRCFFYLSRLSTKDKKYLANDYLEIICHHKDLVNLTRLLTNLTYRNVNTNVIDLVFSHLDKNTEDTSKVADVLEIIHHSSASYFLLSDPRSENILTSITKLPQSMVFLSKCLVLLGKTILLVDDKQTGNSPLITIQFLLDLGENALTFSYGIHFLDKYFNSEFFEAHKTVLVKLLGRCATHAMSLVHLISNLNRMHFNLDLTNLKTLNTLEHCAPKALYFEKTLDAIAAVKDALLTQDNMNKVLSLSPELLDTLESMYSLALTSKDKSSDAQYLYIASPATLKSMLTFLLYIPNLKPVILKSYQENALLYPMFDNKLADSYQKLRLENITAFCSSKKDSKQSQKDRQTETKPTSAIRTSFWNNPLYSKDALKVIFDLAFPHSVKPG